MGSTCDGSTTSRVGRYTSERRLIRNAGMTHETERFVRTGLRIHPMNPKVTTTVEVTVDVAKCLRAIALILFVILV
jgi:hypothetical protein